MAAEQAKRSEDRLLDARSENPGAELRLEPWRLVGLLRGVLHRERLAGDRFAEERTKLLPALAFADVEGKQVVGAVAEMLTYVGQNVVIDLAIDLLVEGDRPIPSGADLDGIGAREKVRLQVRRAATGLEPARLVPSSASVMLLDPLRCSASRRLSCPPRGDDQPNVTNDTRLLPTDKRGRQRIQSAVASDGSAETHDLPVR